MNCEFATRAEPVEARYLTVSNLVPFQPECVKDIETTR